MNALMLLSRAFFPDARVYKEAKALASSGSRVRIWAWDRWQQYPRREQYGDILVERMQVKARYNAGPTVSQMLRWVTFTLASFAALRRQNFDVVHCHDLDTLPLGYLLARWRRTGLVFDAHEPNYYAYWSGRHRWLLSLALQVEVALARRADVVLVTNRFQEAKYRRIGVPSVFSVPNYPEAETLRSLEQVGVTRREDDVIVFGRVGTIYQDTGLDETVEAFERAVARFPQIRLRVAGRVQQGYLRRFERLAKRMSAFAEITGPYHYAEMPKLYEGLDVSLLAYRKTAWFREITPVKFFESLSQAVPVIATDIGGIGDIIDRLGCGLALKDGAPDQIEEAIAWMVEHPERRERMGPRGLTAVRDEYNWETSKRELLRAYRQLATR